MRLLIAILLLWGFSANAQTAFPIKLKQFEWTTGAGKYIASDVSGKPIWRTDSMTRWQDTTLYLATKHDLTVSGLTIPGASGQVLYKDATGNLAATNGMYYLPSSNSLTLGGAITGGTIVSSSFALGSSTITGAEAKYSMVVGYQNLIDAQVYQGINGSSSALIGVQNSMSSGGNGNLGVGAGNALIGASASLITGFNGTARGLATYTSGEGNISRASHSAYFGRFAVDSTNASTNTWVSTDPVLTVGNGASTSARSNALELLKNGNLRVAGTIKSISGGFIFPDGTVQTTAATGSGGADGNNYLSGTTTSLGPATGTGYNLTFSRVGFSDLVTTIRIPSANSQLTNDAGYITGAHNHSIAQVNDLTDSLLVKQKKFTAGTNLTWNAAHDTLNANLTAAVSSFNGRTGAVVPGSSDYTKSMIGLPNVQNVDQTNASNITSGTLSAARIANGSLHIDKLSATGTRDATTILYGDNTFKPLAGAATTYNLTTSGNSWGQIASIATASSGSESGVLEISIAGDNHSSGGTDFTAFLVYVTYSNVDGSAVVVHNTSTLTNVTTKLGLMANSSYSVNYTGVNILVQVNAGSFASGSYNWTATVVSKVKNLTLF